MIRLWLFGMYLSRDCSAIHVSKSSLINFSYCCEGCLLPVFVGDSNRYSVVFNKTDLEPSHFHYVINPREIAISSAKD